MSTHTVRWFLWESESASTMTRIPGELSSVLTDGEQTRLVQTFEIVGCGGPCYARGPRSSVCDTCWREAMQARNDYYNWGPYIPQEDDNAELDR